jgi:hypothetical protein
MTLLAAPLLLLLRAPQPTRSAGAA